MPATPYAKLASQVELCCPHSRFHVHLDINPVLPHLDNMCNPEITTLIRFDPLSAHQGCLEQRKQQPQSLFYNHHLSETSKV